MRAMQQAARNLARAAKWYARRRAAATRIQACAPVVRTQQHSQLHCYEHTSQMDVQMMKPAVAIGLAGADPSRATVKRDHQRHACIEA